MTVLLLVAKCIQGVSGGISVLPMSAMKDTSVSAARRLPPCVMRSSKSGYGLADGQMGIRGR